MRVCCFSLAIPYLVGSAGKSGVFWVNTDRIDSKTRQIDECGLSAAVPQNTSSAAVTRSRYMIKRMDYANCPAANGKPAHRWCLGKLLTSDARHGMPSLALE